MVSLPGQKLKGQLQVALQCPKLLNVTAETDIVKEESWTELLWERASVSAGGAGNVPSLMLVTQFWQKPLKRPGSGDSQAVGDSCIYFSFLHCFALQVNPFQFSHSATPTRHSTDSQNLD